ncbi:MAG: carbohydrate ABC transporter permease [Clostridiales bacterium]|nr:carbohydrate ABC transporter permease [Clostridiales bacterium]
MNEFEHETQENVNTSIPENTEVAESTVPLTETDNLVQGVMHEKDMKTVAQKQAIGKIMGQVGLYAFLTIMAFIVVFPFIWMIATSLKSLNEYYDAKLELVLFPNGPRDFLNYAEVFSTTDLEDYFLNTLIIGVCSTVMSLVITVLSAFALARLEFKGKNVLFAFLLATMMIPGELFTITNYKTVGDFGWLMQFGETGWLNSFFNLTIPFLVSVFYIYLLRQNFMQIPNELYLAAKVDGTNDFKYLWKVMIPLALPTLISITILKMMGAWNTYMWPKLTTTNPDYYLITIGLREAFTSADNQQPDIPLQMAAVTMVSIPLFLVFVFLRKYIMKGVSRSGIKG